MEKDQLEMLQWLEKNIEETTRQRDRYAERLTNLQRLKQLATANPVCEEAVILYTNILKF